MVKFKVVVMLRRFIVISMLTIALVPLLFTSRMVSTQISHSIQTQESILLENIKGSSSSSPLIIHDSGRSDILNRPIKPLIDLHSEDPPTKMTLERKEALAPKKSTLLWANGCIQPPRNNSTKPFTSLKIEENIEGPPTGLVVVLAMAPSEMSTRVETVRRMCYAVKSQFKYFLASQQLDMLFVIQEDETNGWTAKAFIDCWNLKFAGKPKKTWRNLDGTTMTTLEYQVTTETQTRKVYIAKTVVQLPKYIQENPAILQEPIIPKSCNAPREYIQATRYYTREMLNFGILKEYEYFLKVDTDIIFRDSIPFFLLQDMKQKDAVFGHTAQYHRGSKTCANGIRHAVANFTSSYSSQSNQQSTSTTLPNEWGMKFCTHSEEVNRDADQYYTNFITGKVEFWQSPFVLEFSKFLNEWPEGFFRYRWTDQIFWHFAMALFLDHFHERVVDYTDLRCMPNKDCWQSSYLFQKYGMDAWHQCPNDGYFLHPKDFRIPKKLEKDPLLLIWNGSQKPFTSMYGADCSKV